MAMEEIMNIFDPSYGNKGLWSRFCTYFGSSMSMFCNFCKVNMRGDLGVEIMCAEENWIAEEWTNGYMPEVCGVIACNNPAIDLVIIVVSGMLFFLNHCEPHGEKVAGQINPAAWP